MSLATKSSQTSPPHSLDAERAVLGAVLLRASAITEVATALAVDDFFLPAHREVFDAMLALDKRRMPIDVISLGDELGTRGMLPRLEGGDAYLVTLAESVSTAENLSHYVRLVRGKATLRRLIATCQETIAQAYVATDPAELIDSLASATTKLVTGDSSALTRMGDLVQSVEDAIHERAERLAQGESVVNGVRFGVTMLDEKTAGLKPGDLAILAADTGGGKTAMAQQAGLLNCTVDAGVTACFNLEMPSVQLVERAIARQGEVNSERLRRGQVDYETWKDRIIPATKTLRGLDYYVEDKSFTLREIASKSRAIRARHPDQQMLVIVDFLQLVEDDAGRNDTRAIIVGRIAKQLKRLAKELNAVVLALSQFKRTLGGEPSMHDLKESGDIEQAADVILLIHNSDETQDGEVDLIVEKFRNGSKGKVRAHWVGRYYEFKDPSYIPDSEPPAEHWQEDAQ